MAIRRTHDIYERFRLPWAGRWSAHDALGRVGDVALVACLFGTTFALGGRHDAGRFLYVATIIVAAIGVFGRGALIGDRVRAPRSVIGLTVAAAVLLTLQVTPLPTVLMHWVAPATQAALPMWTADGFGHWSTISVTPGETREAIALTLAHGLLAITLMQRLKTIADVRQTLQWVAVAAVGSAVIGLLQPALSNGKLLWVYDAPPRRIGDQVQGTFANRNHFAHFLVLGLVPLMVGFRGGGAATHPGRRGSNGGCSSVARGTQVATRLASVGVGAAILATQSRGGALALAASLSTSGVLAWRAGWLRAGRLIAGLAAATAVLSALSFYDYEAATSRIDSLVSADVDELDRGSSRRAIWAANVEAFAAQPLFGFGAGSHREVYPLFFEGGIGREFTHAESGYLQVASETGIAGILLLVFALAVIFRWATTAWRHAGSDGRPLVVASVAGLAASVTHSLVDFVWYLPALLGVAIALAACLGRLAESVEPRTDELNAHTRSHSRRLHASDWRLGLLSAVYAWCLATAAIPASTAFGWDAYLRGNATLRTLSADVLQGRLDTKRHSLGMVRMQTERCTVSLRDVVERDPSNARAHLRLAGRLLQRFELENADSPNPMPIGLIRDAVLRSHFPDGDATLRWLHRALGDQADLLVAARQHARIAVSLCPLQGQGYLHLRRLDFLTGADGESIADSDRLIDQALAVRPNDGGVLFEAGRQLHLQGRLEGVADLWRKSLATPGSHRGRLVAFAARLMTASEFIERLEPDGPSTGLAVTQYARAGDRDDLVTLAAHAEQAARSPDPESSDEACARRWRDVSKLYRTLERADDAVACSERALALAAHAFDVRLEAAAALRLADRHTEADPHLRWCLARRPELSVLSDWLIEGRQANDPIRRNAERLRRRSRPVSTAGLPPAISAPVAPSPWDAQGEIAPASVKPTTPRTPRPR